jgi:hypothetical protein
LFVSSIALYASIGSPAIHPSVDGRDLRYPAAALGVLQLQHLPVRPVEVVGDEGYLLAELIEGVA